MEDQNQNPIDLEQNDQQQDDAHIDTSAPEGNTPPQVEAPSIDFAALYRESIRERQRVEAENDELRRKQTAPQQAAELDYEKLGIDPTVGRALGEISRSVIQEQMRESLGDVGQMAQAFKRQQAITSAEAAFYQEFPQLVPYRTQLSSQVAGMLQTESNITPHSFKKEALAYIGGYTVLSAPANAPQTPPSNTQPTPTRTTPPARVNGAPPATSGRVRTLSELERSSIRKAGFDPNKREDIDKFFAIIENDEPMVVT